MTFCMNVSRFMNLAAIFSLDLESQYMGVLDEVNVVFRAAPSSTKVKMVF